MTKSRSDWVPIGEMAGLSLFFVLGFWKSGWFVSQWTAVMPPSPAP
jgi:hypothetical protein